MRRFLCLTLPSLAVLGGLAAAAITLDRPRAACGRALALLDAEDRAAEGVVLLQRAAQAGAPECQNVLGVRISHGQGVPEDAAQAAFWFRRAAYAGHVPGQRNLGYALTRGLGVTRDADAAFYWLRKAADQGDRFASFHLGEMLAARRDPAEAARRYRSAAEQGYAPAQRELGDLYRLGRGVGQDTAQAEVWLRRAVAQDDVDARFLLAVVLRGDDGRHTNSEEAARLMREAAELGFVQAQRELGYMYRMGWCVGRDPKQASFWLRRAAERGDDIGQFLLAATLLPSVGGEREPGATVDWSRKPVGKAKTKTKVQSTPVQLLGAREAAYWLGRAAAQGYAPAQYNLARLYFDGSGVPRDLVLAYVYLSQAAEQGDEPAIKALGQLAAALDADTKARAETELQRRKLAGN